MNNPADDRPAATLESDAAFIDAACSSCGKRFGWYARMIDRPACPRCGHRPAREALQASQDQVDSMRRLDRELREANPGWERWREARIAAGLTLRQATKLLGVSGFELSEIEGGRVSPTAAMAERMKRCYGGEQL